MMTMHVGSQMHLMMVKMAAADIGLLAIDKYLTKTSIMTFTVTARAVRVVKKLLAKTKKFL
jgi:hypothetical protein